MIDRARTASATEQASQTVSFARAAVGCACRFGCVQRPVTERGRYVPLYVQ